MVCERALCRAILLMSQTMRYFLLLPLIIATAPLFVLSEGANSLSISLNTLAILFLIEVCSPPLAQSQPPCRHFLRVNKLAPTYRAPCASLRKQHIIHPRALLPRRR